MAGQGQKVVGGVVQLVQQALAPIKAELEEKIAKYSGELVRCMVCAGKGVRVNHETKEPLPAADMGMIPCLNCGGTGKRRV